VKYGNAALLLLIAGMLAQFSWQWAPREIEVQGQVWNAQRSVLVLLCFGMLANAYRSRAVLLVLGMLAVFEVLTFGCSLWWLADPLRQVVGEEQCSARFNMPLGLFGLAAGLVLAGHLAKGKD
jgi:hypothetical protein